MKKLNRKGFTLIELLAVIVILAIIVVVTVPTIINTIADARVQSIWNLAGSTANSYDTMKAQDLLATDKTVSGFNVTNEWQCIGGITIPVGTDGTKSLADVLDLNGTDLVLIAAAVGNVNSETKPGCSAIKLNDSGGAEVVLVAKDGGKFAISGEDVWAISTETIGHNVKKSAPPATPTP